MAPFEVARLFVGIAAGVMLGWLAGSPPGSFGSIQWLDLLTAIGAIGAALGAIWIATNQRRSHLRDQRLSGALQIMKRRHWMYSLTQEIQRAKEFNWPTTREDQQCRDAVSTAKAGLAEKLKWRKDLSESPEWDSFGQDAESANRIVAYGEKQVADAEMALRALGRRSKEGREIIRAVAEKIDDLDSIPANGDPKFLQLAYLARSDMDMAMALVWDYKFEPNLRGNLQKADSFLWEAFGRINVAEDLVKLECEEFIRREQKGS